MPYSQLIANGNNFSAKKIVTDGKECTRVFVQHPATNKRSFLLVYDDQFRLIERQLIFKIEPDPEPRIYERHVFSNYKEYEDPSGEVIWFPTKAVYHDYVGNSPDGTPVEVEQRTINIREIKFNVDIPDEKFVIKFPLGIKMYDGVSGMGWMDNTLERVHDESLTALLEQKIDQAVGTLSGGMEANATPARTANDGAKIDTEDVVVPVSEVPLGQIETGRTSKRWAIWGLIVGLLLLAGCIYWLVR